MTNKFSFEYLNSVCYASAQAFHEDGILKYRVAFESHLIVLYELPDKMGTPGGSEFVQEVDINEEALPEELIYALGYALEEVEFYPGSFWVTYEEGDEYYLARFTQNDNRYKMIQCRLPELDRIQLPVVITKEANGNEPVWTLDGTYPTPVWFDKVVRAIEKHENDLNAH